jgi:hypothetical protein
MLIIKVTGGRIYGNSQYIKRTSDARAFGGRIRLTDDKSQAKQFTRKKDAERHARVIEERCSGRWSSKRDNEKYGIVTCIVEEL